MKRRPHVRRVEPAEPEPLASLLLGVAALVVILLFVLFLLPGFGW